MNAGEYLFTMGVQNHGGPGNPDNMFSPTNQAPRDDPQL